VTQVISENNGQSSDVQVVVSRIKEELQTLLQQRDDIVRRIGTVKKTVAGLVSLFGTAELDPQLQQVLGYKDTRRPGLSAECRMALMSAERFLSAREVRDRVVTRLPSLANHRDSLASVTTILNRLIRYGEAQRVRDESGVHRWGWATQLCAATDADCTLNQTTATEQQ
jgi:hypothetical protein